MEEHDIHSAGSEHVDESVHNQGPVHGLEGQPPPIPPGIHQYFNVMQDMRPPPTDEEIFAKIKKHGGEEFVGTTDPAVADEWLRKFERIAERFNCTPEKKLKFATYLLEKDALDWWETVPGSRNRPLTLT